MEEENWVWLTGGSTAAGSTRSAAKDIPIFPSSLSVATVRDRVALLLATKETGRTVTLDHILEKVGRDVSFLEHRDVGADEVKEALDSLIGQGAASTVKDGYLRLPRIDEIVSEVVTKAGSELNRSYMLVWIAKKYYPRVADQMLPFLTGRPISAVKIFSGKKNPIEELSTIFVRYARRKPKPVNLTVDTKERLLTLVDDHCVDFIPYVHKIGSNEPDIFVLDMDAGSALLKHRKAFGFIKFVTAHLAEMLSEKGVQPMVKFSGSRGFQVWAFLDNSKMPANRDLFALYRDMAVSVQSRLEERLQERSGEVEDKFHEIMKAGRPFTTSIVAHKEERASKILVDWSSMKPAGDVRAPFSIHYRTGLVSLPLTLNEIEGFEMGDAEPFKVAEHIEKYRGAAEIRLSDPSALLGFLE
ncbi:MAG: hypothetical protein ACE5KU_00660 [Nitrososphaerales archaeon]